MTFDDDNPPGQISDADRSAVVTALSEEMSDLFHGYIGGDVSFEELTFEMYDTLQTLYAIASGDVSIEFEYEDEDADLTMPYDGNGHKERSGNGN